MWPRSDLHVWETSSSALNLSSPPFQCGNMAREGLRTLVVAKKSLSEEQYQDFEVRSVDLTALPCFTGSFTLHQLMMDSIMRTPAEQ